METADLMAAAATYIDLIVINNMKARESAKCAKLPFTGKRRRLKREIDFVPDNSISFPFYFYFHSHSIAGPQTL